MTLDSVANAPQPRQRRQQSVGPHVTPNPGVEGIDEYRTNTFQIQSWLAVPVVPVVPIATIVAAVPAVPSSQAFDEDVETDHEFEEEQQSRPN